MLFESLTNASIAKYVRWKVGTCVMGYKVGHKREKVSPPASSLLKKGNKSYCPKIDVMSGHSKGAKGLSGKPKMVGNGFSNGPKKMK